jgi:transposase InsO family protein
MIAEAHTAEPRLSIRRLCKLTETGRTWYYQHPSAAERARRDVALRDAIERMVLDFPGYGYRRVTKQLQRDEWVVNHKRVLRVMRAESLLCQLKKHFVATTDSSHCAHRYPNLIKELAIERLDQVWVADITYIHLPTAFVYLAAVLDAYSRRCIGWQLSRTIDTQLALAALEHALVARQPVAGVIHHSDQGVQYASQSYITRLETAGLQPSMSAVGNPYENARAESFFKTLKREEVYRNDYQSFAEAEAQLDHFIDAVSNQKRLHSSLGYRPPVEFETMAVDFDQPSLSPWFG